MQQVRTRYPHQLEAKARAKALGFLGFFMGMRTGKTLTSIDTVQELGGLPCLIICPLAAIATWVAELKREGVPDSDIVQVRARSSNSAIHAKNKLLNSTAKFFIMNFDTVERLDATNLRSNWQPPKTMAALATGMEIPDDWRAPDWMSLEDWRAIIIDESYRIANGESNLTQYLLKRPTPGPGRQFRFCLSGTPAAEHPYQYAAQFIWMQGQFFGCTSVARYMATFWEWNEYRREYRILDPMHLEAIREHVQKFAYCVTMYELGLGCEVFRTEREVEANTVQKDLFQWIKTASLYEHKKTGDITEMMPGPRAIMHRQVAAGVHPMTDEIISDAKILDFIQYHKDTNLQLLVSSYFKPPIFRALELCKKHGIKAAIICGGTNPADAEGYRLAFQAGELDIIIGQEDKISRALEFSAAGAIFILSASYSEEAREQLEERAQHVDRKVPYEIISQHTTGSIDKSLTNVLTNKKQNARFYLDQFNREILKG